MPRKAKKVAFSFFVPSAGSGSSPIDINNVYRERSVDPSKLIISQRCFPEQEYMTPWASYDVLGPMTGRLNDSHMDAQPKASAGRNSRNVTLAPFFRDASKLVRPSESVNQRRLGTINKMSGNEVVMLRAEEVANQIDVEKELMSISALTGSLTATIAGSTLTYTYPVQNTTPSILWDVTAGTDAEGNPIYTGDPIGDLEAAALLLIGECQDESLTLYMPLAVAQVLAKHTRFVNLCKQSVLAGLLGPGSSGGTVTNQQIGQLISLFTGINNVVLYSQTYKLQTSLDGNGDAVYTKYPFLPHNKILLLGDPAYNQPLGAFGMTPTINNGDRDNPLPGRFMRIIDHNINQPNGSLEIYGGFSGVPEIHVPLCCYWSQVIT